MATPAQRKCMALERELEYFNARKAELLKAYQGKFVLIKGDQLVGAFDTAATAYEEGVSKFGIESFLVRRVLEQDEAYRNAALRLGLTHARL